MATFSARPTLATMKQTVLKTIKGLVSKNLYRAIELLFQPCCDITITDVQAVCSSVTPGNYDITITLDKSVNMVSNGIFIALINNHAATLSGSPLFSYNDSTKLVLSDVSICDSIGGNKSVTVLFFLPTGNANFNNFTTFEDLTPGAFTIVLSSTQWSFPSCP